MFNFFFRPYVPGFRVGPDDVPGFNIDDNGLPRRANASFEDTLPDSAAQRYPDAAQTQSPHSISFRLPGAEGWVLSVPPIGSPGFRVSPQDDVPGFNVRPRDDVPGFNLDENGVRQQETTWSDGMLPGSVAPQDLNSVQSPTPPSGEEEPTPPTPPQLPEWPYKLATILSRLSTAFDPRTGPPIAINPLRGLGSAVAPGADPWLSSSASRQPADINVRSDAAAMQDANPQPAAQQEMRNAWPQPLRNRWPYAMRSAVPPSIPSARPPPHFNLIPANGDDADKQAPQQQMPLQQ